MRAPSASSRPGGLSAGAWGQLTTSAAVAGVFLCPVGSAVKLRLQSLPCQSYGACCLAGQLALGHGPADPEPDPVPDPPISPPSLTLDLPHGRGPAWRSPGCVWPLSLSPRSAAPRAAPLPGWGGGTGAGRWWPALPPPVRSPGRLTARSGRPGPRAERRGAWALPMLPGQEAQACPEAPHCPEPSATPAQPQVPTFSAAPEPLCPALKPLGGKPNSPPVPPELFRDGLAPLTPPCPAWTL